MKKRAFTLIELLVVIAIIALLLSIIVPSLRTAKEYATGAACLSNQKGLAVAWHLYQGEFDGFLVGGSTYSSGTRATPYRWVEQPMDNSKIPVSGPLITMEYRLNGIRAGSLYPFTNSEKLYHCPNDKNMTNKTEPYATYRSYSISGLMNSEDFLTRQSNIYSPINSYRTATFPGSGTKTLKVAVKFSDIKGPGNKYVFVEEDTAAKSQEWNYGGFVLMGGGDYWTWWDWPAFYHNDMSTLSFADGHGEKKRWQDQRTIKLMKGEITDRRQEGNPDIIWMNQGYLPMQ
jgi:prepilin-type N-terminal cleavage/methylation domain-containing protein